MQLLSEQICGLKHPGNSNLGLSDFSEVKRLISEAQKFVISDDLYSALWNVADNKPSSMTKNVGFARAPFETCWYEFKPAKEGTLFTSPESSIPNRVGVLIQASPDGAAGEQHIFWKHGDEFGACPVAMAWDFSDNPLPRDIRAQMLELPAIGQRAVTAEEVKHCTTGQCNHPNHRDVAKFLWNQGARPMSEHQAYADLCNRFVSFHSLLYMPMWRLLSKTVLKGEMTHQHYLKIVDSWVSDYDGEILFFLAFLCFLNTKNSLEIKTVDRTEDNVRRGAKGKLPLHSHKILKLKLSEQQKTRARSNGITSESEMRLHLVRGHFKNRKTGRYWWSAFSRGDAAVGIVTKDYVVS